MLDIRLIRERADFVRERLATRGADDATKIDSLLKVDAERRKTETELQQLQAERTAAIEQARHEAEAQIAASKAQLQQEVTNLKQNLAGESDALANQITESILRRSAA